MNLNLTTATRYGLNILAAFGASMALYFGRSIFVPLTIAGLLAALLWPWANWMQRRLKLPWFFACSTSIGLLVLLVLMVVSLVALSVPLLLNDLPNPNSPADIQKKYDQLRAKFVTDSPLREGAGRTKPPGGGREGAGEDKAADATGEGAGEGKSADAGQEGAGASKPADAEGGEA